MQAATKVVFNTAILYLKIIASLSIALISVPLVLKALGGSDYGLYNLVAGIVTMLAFLNNSMTVSTQRYMSVAMGEGNITKINKIYNASFLLHAILSLFIVISLEVFGVPSIGKLNIDPNRIWCAHLIFQFLIVSTFAKVISVPFDAIMNAHEDMLPFSVIELIDSILMLAIAFSLHYVSIDKLAFYGFGVAFIAVLTLVMKYVWCKKTYKNFKLTIKDNVGKNLVKDMMGFTGWNLFGGLAMMGRNQGVAIIFNIFQGTLANAAYGVANQINGALSHFSSTFQRAINPQLMKSEGMGNRNRLHKISIISSKFSVLALCLFAIPLIIEMEDVLVLWMKDNTPPSTLELSRCILTMSILYQFSTGLMSAIQATGQIKYYQITMSLIILINVPSAYLILKMGYPIYYVTIGFIVLEIVSLITRVLMAVKIAGLTIQSFTKGVVLPCLLIIVTSTLTCLIPHYLLTSLWPRLILVCFSYGLTYLLMMWYIVIDANQRKSILYKIFKRNNA